jgi:hypothetical protein
MSVRKVLLALGTHSLGQTAPKHTKRLALVESLR